MNFGEIWKLGLINPILNLLVFFYKIFEWLHFPGPLGFAIIAMTMTIRLILYPLMNAQMKSAKKMSDLKPHLDAISAKHKNDKQALQQAQMALYKEHGINPAAGCLPLLVQMPVLIALYNVFYQVLNNSNIGKVITDINHIIYLPAFKLDSLNLSFLGIGLGIKPSQWQTHGWWLLSIPVVTGLLQWYQTKLMMPAKATDSKPSIQNQKLNPPSGGQNSKDKKDGKKPESDTAAEMQQQMAIISPLMFAMFAYQFPLGLALYWNVFGLFGIMQQLKINKK
jgi:YidC/Oxa1 family membrane protein insertase